MSRNPWLHAAIAADGRPKYVLCAAAQVAPTTLYHLLAGRMTPTSAVAQRLADVLGVPESELFPAELADAEN